MASQFDKFDQLFPRPQALTFRAISQAVRNTGCEVRNEDNLLSRLTCKTPKKFQSWGKAMTIRVEPVGQDQSRVIFEIEFPSIAVKISESRHQHAHVDKIINTASMLIQSGQVS
jgi:hypothetical protein